MMIIENLKRVLLTEIAVDLGIKSLSPDEDLLEQGIIDSLGIMRLTTFMERKLGIKVLDEDIIPENFQCLNNMVKFVENKLRNN